MNTQGAIGKYIGIPYRHNGRDLSGVDCLGLIAMFYKDLGIALIDGDGAPIAEDWYVHDPERYERGLESVGVEADGELQPLDLVYFELGDGVVRHAGIMVSKTHFIHVREGRRVDVSRYRGFWRKHHVGTRRLTKREGTES